MSVSPSHIALHAVLDEDEVRSDPSDALGNVGWGKSEDPGFKGGLTSESPFVVDIDNELDEIGGLDQLLNPATVVNLEKQVVELRLDLAEAVGKDMKELGTDIAALRKMDDAEFDDEAVATEEVLKLRGKLDKLRAKLNKEKRSVFRGWLKDLFLAQAVLSFVLSFVMSTSPSTLFGSFSWFNDTKLNMDVSIQVLGFWWWWLFIVPSLRSRRPTGAQKRALDLAFIATPAVSLLAPVVTKDTGIIWGADFVATLACFGYAYVVPEGGGGGGGGTGAWIWKALDFGAGRERGVRK